MPDAVEVARQDMEQEAAHELLGGQAHRLAAMRLAIVLPAETDVAVVDGQQAIVGDRDAVRVAAKVVEDAGGSVEGRLGVDDPVSLAHGLEVAVEGGGLGERCEGAVKPQAALAEGAHEPPQKEGAEAPGENPDGQEKAGSAGDPAIALRDEAAAGDDAVEVGMEGEIRAPGVEHGEEADLGAEVPGVGRNLAQGAGRGAEEQVVQRALVLPGEGGDLGGEREDDVVVLAVEQFAATAGEPGVAGGALALGAVAVAAGAVAETAVPAAVTLLHQPAESGRAATLDGAHDACLQAGQGIAGALAEGLSVAPEDIRDFEPRAAQRSARGVSAAGCGRGSRSSGLVAEQTLEQATCR